MKQLFLLVAGSTLIICAAFGQSTKKKQQPDKHLGTYIQMMNVYNDSVRQLQLLAPKIGDSAYRQRMKLLMEHRAVAAKSAAVFKKEEKGQPPAHK